MQKLNKQNLRGILLTKILLLFFLFNANAQSSIDKRFIDSISINLDSLIGKKFFKNGYNIELGDGLLFIFPHEEAFFLKFNLNTHQIARVSFGNSYNNSFYDRRHISTNKITTYNAAKNEIYEFDWNGHLVNKIRLKLFWNKYKIPSFGNFIPTENIRFLLPISTTYKGFDKMQSEKELKKYYGRKGLIGVFDDRGKLTKKVGHYDAIYQDRLLEHLHQYFFTLVGKNKIVLSQRLSHDLHVIDLDTKSSINLNFKGKHIEKDQDQLPTFESNSREDYNSYIIESFYYGSIQTWNDKGLIYRYYQKSDNDTTATINLYLPEESKEESKKSKNKNRCVPPSEREINQEKIISNKEVYFQVVDIEKNEVLYDDVFPFLGKFVYLVNDETIWTGELLSGEIKLYKYHVVFE
jgi:hypothetical protein